MEPLESKINGGFFMPNLTPARRLLSPKILRKPAGAFYL